MWQRNFRIAGAGVRERRQGNETQQDQSGGEAFFAGGPQVPEATSRRGRAGSEELGQDPGATHITLLLRTPNAGRRRCQAPCVLTPPVGPRSASSRWPYL